MSNIEINNFVFINSKKIVKDEIIHLFQRITKIKSV